MKQKILLSFICIFYANCFFAQRINLYAGTITKQVGIGTSFDIKQHNFEVLLPISLNKSLNIPSDFKIGLSEQHQESYKNSQIDIHFTPSVIYQYYPFKKYETISIGIGPNLNISKVRYYYPSSSFSGWQLFNISSIYDEVIVNEYRLGLTAMIKARYRFMGLYAMSNIANNNSFASIGAFISINTKKNKNK